MTLTEVLVVVAVLLILAVLLLQWLQTARKRSSRIGCNTNLKQVGLAYRLWANDNFDNFPMRVPVTSGGSMEMAATGDVLQTFLVMSNELFSPIVLHCWEDSATTATRSFAGLSNSNISYFVGVDVTNYASPQMILAGDSNFEIGGVPVRPGLCSFSTNDPVAWTGARHRSTTGSGNLGLADGSVQSLSSGMLCHNLELTGLATNRFAIP